MGAFGEGPLAVGTLAERVAAAVKTMEDYDLFADFGVEWVLIGRLDAVKLLLLLQDLAVCDELKEDVIMPEEDPIPEGSNPPYDMYCDCFGCRAVLACDNHQSRPNYHRIPLMCSYFESVRTRATSTPCPVCDRNKDRGRRIQVDRRRQGLV